MCKKVFVNFTGALYKRHGGPAYCEAYEKRRLKYDVDEAYIRQMIKEGEIVFSEGGEAFMEGAVTAFGYDGFLISVSAISDGRKRFEQSIRTMDAQGEKDLISAFVSFCKDDCGFCENDEVWYICDDNDFKDLNGHTIVDERNKLLFATNRISETYLAKLVEAFPVHYKAISRILRMQAIHLKGCDGVHVKPFEMRLNIPDYSNLHYRASGEYTREEYDVYSKFIKKDRYSDDELNIIMMNWCPPIDDEEDGVFAAGFFHDRTNFLIRSRIALLRLFRDNREVFDRTMHVLIDEWLKRDDLDRMIMNDNGMHMHRFAIKAYLDFLGGRPCKPRNSERSHFFSDECWADSLMPAEFYKLAYDDLEDFDSPELQAAIDGYHTLIEKH